MSKAARNISNPASWTPVVPAAQVKGTNGTVTLDAPAVIGGALVYWDANHMSAQFSRTLAPFLLEQVQDGTGS